MPLRSLAVIAAAAVLMLPCSLLAAPDDQPDTCDSAATFDLAELQHALEGRLEQSGDIDAFVLLVEPGTLYRFNRWTGDCGLCPRSRVFTGSDCRFPTAEFDRWGTLVQDWFLGPASGRVFLLLDSPEGGWGDYRIRIEPVAGPFTDAHEGTLELATPIGEGQVVSSSLEFDLDRDVFVIETLPGHIYRLEAAAGFSESSGLTADFFAPPPPGQFKRGVRLHSEGCRYTAQGCGRVRAVAPEGEPSRLFISVERLPLEDPTRPAAPYAIRVVDEGAFVPLPAGIECDQAPTAPLGEQIMVEATDYWGRVWELRGEGGGNVYRATVEAIIGDVEFDFGLSDASCLTGPIGHSLTARRVYLRVTDGQPMRLFTSFRPGTFEPDNPRARSGCVIRVEDLGVVPDAEGELAAISGGGRVVSGALEHGGDTDTFTFSGVAGVRYRVEVRSRTAGRTLGAFAYGSSVIGAVFSNRAASDDHLPGFRGLTLQPTTGGEIRVDIRRTDHLDGEESLYDVRVYPAACRADWDNSGGVGADDLYAYLNDYFNGRGEFDGAGADPSVGDLLGYVQSYFMPCR